MLLTILQTKNNILYVGVALILLTVLLIPV